MWKRRLRLVKDVLSALGILATVMVPLYGWMTNALNDYSKGLLLGAVLVAGVALSLQFLFDFWVVSITDAEEIAFSYLRERDTVARESRILIDNTELKVKENEWHIFGHYGLLVESVTYEVVIDARTGTIRKLKFDKVSDHMPVGAKRID